jgi:outer membrane lipoprotein SlyB
MKTLIALAAVAAASLALGGCAGDAALQATFQHLEGCDRHYTGSFGTGIPSGTVQIDCKAQAATPAPAAP